MLILYCSLLIFTCFVEGWNNRAKCSTLSRIIWNPRLSVWEALILRKDFQIYKQLIKLKKQNIDSIHLRSIQLPSNTTKCQNILKYGQTCCNWQQFEKYSSLLLSTYQKYVFQNLHYPIFAEFARLAKEVANNKCSNTYISQAQIMKNLSDQFQQEQTLLSGLVEEEINFIQSTLCTLCLSTKDFPNFIYPAHPYNGFIFNVDYFEERVQKITDYYMKLEGMHSKVTQFIENIRVSMNNPKEGICSELSQQMTKTKLREKKLCFDKISCRKIAVKYFGEAGAPQNGLYISQRSNNLNIGLGSSNYYLGLNKQVGFAGYQSGYEKLYGTRVAPKVKISNAPNYEELI